MTIDEAIRRLTGCAYTMDVDNRLDEKDAIKLGIEALKRVKAQKSLIVPSPPQLLPGETKAVDQRVANIGYRSSEVLKKQRR